MKGEDERDGSAKCPGELAPKPRRGESLSDWMLVIWLRVGLFAQWDQAVLVELMRFELTTSAVRLQRSPI